MRIPIGAAWAALALSPFAAAATPEADEIVVIGRTVTTSAVSIEIEREIFVDIAAALKNIPGANVNRNGVITGIAQYRGMFGDRVAVDIDQLGTVSGGPNAMDTPLTYMSPMMTEELVVARGVASVALAPETIGGHVGTRTSRGEFSDGDFEMSGVLGTRYASNGDNSTSVARLTLADAHHRIAAIAALDNGSDIETPAGEIRPSRINRDRYDLSYAYANGENRFLVYAGKLDTGLTGTPALPMDIIFIETDLFGARIEADVRPGLVVEGRFSYNDVAHVMDNFSLREGPPPMRNRLNTTGGSGSQFYLAGAWDLGDDNLLLGFDGIVARHESVISNPNDATFRIDNFVTVERNLNGVFAEWTRTGAKGQIELGLRYNQVETDAGDVAAAGLSGMMDESVAMLADEFNAARRALRWSSLDGVFKYRHSLTGNAALSMEIGRKSRAPSYQELYLWLPLQATGGLADGRNYIGSLGLEAERSTELVLGLDVTQGRFAVSPQVFYKKIDNYIQGTPSTNAVANAVSMMMSGTAALQFENVDAEIWGFDMAWRYDISERLSLDGVVSAVRGRRSDADDELYRLSPYNASFALTYRADAWSLRSEVRGISDQDHVSSFNDETETPGYWRIDVGFVRDLSASLRFEARVDNLLDEQYQDHVAGINRAGGGDIPVGIRLYGPARTATVGFIYDF